MTKYGKQGNQGGHKKFPPGEKLTADSKQDQEDSLLYLQQEFKAIDKSARNYSDNLMKSLGTIKDKDSHGYSVIENHALALVVRSDVPEFYCTMAKEYLVAIRDSKGDTKVLDEKVAEIDAKHAKDFEEHKKARDKEAREVLEADTKFHVALNSIDTKYIKKDVIETNAKEAVGLFIKYDYSKKDALNIVTSAITEMNKEVAESKDGEKGSKVFGEAIYEAGKRAVNIYKSRQESKDQGIN